MKTAPAPAKVIPPAPAPKVAAKPAAPVNPPATPAAAVATPAAAPKAPKPEEKKYSMTGKRDPFISPVVNRQGGSGCSTGKKCLDIEQIAVRGVVKADTGMIAVVTNGLNKAYFLRENDPVFNGYVVKITVDSVVFKQNFQDRLGKPFTKDVVKRLTTPAV
jgi:Tfp pilus assembly protein PilP